MTTLLSILLFAPQEGQKGGGYSSLIFLVLIIVIFYLFFIRPQMKRNKDQKKYREGLKNGDRIVTIGGIHGKIIEVRDTSFIIESEGTRLKIEKSAVAMDQSAQIDDSKK
ncbi:MAG: preprotein translocase subunit YajC [Bacteroidales bacterium]|nr:preprotein translocase subunit YajC [Lentimicrobiaceae bacterium]MDD5693998.1 preprotein translocase subunit YajC [Bacteroidales bacterium]